MEDAIRWAAWRIDGGFNSLALLRTFSAHDRERELARTCMNVNASFAAFSVFSPSFPLPSLIVPFPSWKGDECSIALVASVGALASLARFIERSSL